ELNQAVEGHAQMSLHEGRSRAPRVEDNRLLAPLLSAYRELRIEHQIGYVHHKLADDGRILSGSPRSQAAFFANFGYLCIAGLCAVHVAVLALVVLAPNVWGSLSRTLAAVAIWLALAALAARAAEQGLQPEREIERYQQYGSALVAIRERFDDAETVSAK